MWRYPIIVCSTPPSSSIHPWGISSALPSSNSPISSTGSSSHVSPVTKGIRVGIYQIVEFFLVSPNYFVRNLLGSFWILVALAQSYQRPLALFYPQSRRNSCFLAAKKRKIRILDNLYFPIKTRIPTLIACLEVVVSCNKFPFVIDASEHCPLFFIRAFLHCGLCRVLICYVVPFWRFLSVTSTIVASIIIAYLTP